MSQIALVMCPYTYPYSVPYQLGYLKSSLSRTGISSKIYDISIDLYVRRSDLEIDTYDQLENWQDEKCFKKVLLPVLDDFFDEIVDILISSAHKIIAFSLFNTNRIFATELAHRLKKKDPRLQIVFGGVDCTISFNSNSYLFYKSLIEKEIVDAVLIGEGDLTFTDYCQGKITEGIISKEKLAKKEFSMLPFIDDLDEVPFPDYQDLSLDFYSGDVMPISLSRGCNFYCTFCEIETLWCNSLRIRGATSIFEEMKYLDKISKKRFLFFNGAYVNCQDELIENLSDMIISEWGDSPRFGWNAWAKVHRNLSRETLVKMKQAGCYELVFGLESGSQKVINDMRKGFLISEAERLIRDVSAAGIDVTVFIIIGYPTEKEEDFQLTLEFLTRNQEHIRAAYCMSECILSDKMLIDPKKFGVKKEKHLDAFNWTSLDGMTFKHRKDRKIRFLEHLKEIGIKSS